MNLGDGRALVRCRRRCRAAPEASAGPRATERAALRGGWAASAISPSPPDGIRSRRCASSRCRPSGSWSSTGGCPSRSPRWCSRRWAGVDALQGRFDPAEPWLGRAEQALRPNAEPAKELLVRSPRAGSSASARGGSPRPKVLFPRERTASSASWSRPIHWRSGLAGASGAGARATGRPPGSTGGARRGVRRRAPVLPTREPRSRRSTSLSGTLARAVDGLAPVLAATPDAGPTHVIRRHLGHPMRSSSTPLHRDMLGDSRVAEDDIERALELAEPDSLILPFLITPARDLPRAAPPATQRRTRRCSPTSSTCSRARRCPLDAANRQGLQEELTESKIRVLRYLPSNLSAPESRPSLPVRRAP